jgi:hypothetical protein
MMNARAITALALAISALACSPREAPAPAQDGPQAWTPPRTSWGDPDIEGIYTNKDENGTPFERPDELAGKQLSDFGPAELAALSAERRERARAIAPSIGGNPEEDTGAGPPHWYEHLEAQNSQAWLVTEPADGKIPALTDAGTARQERQRAALAKRDIPDSPKDMTLYDRCITRGLPGSMMPAIYGNAYDITQAPGYVAIRYEMVHEARIIPLDGSPRAAGDLRFYMGDARGRWEGDTLVVETTNFRDGAAYRNASADLKITERFTPIDADTLRWEIRFEDPTTWVAPWSIAMPLKRDESLPLFEYACHEGNLGLRNILSAARAAERAAAGQ